MPSLAGSREMNGYDYERGLSRYNGPTQNGYDMYREDPYGRDDMRADMDERYRRAGAAAMPARNGGPAFDTYGEQNSMYDFREVRFDLDHLATFAAGTRSGFIPPEEGLHKLRAMENSMGIWTMRCTLSIDRQCLVINENGSGEELERFPLAHVVDPTAIFKNDRREIYNNLILFTVVDDPIKKKPTQADMHIFQSIKAPAQDIVDEILAAKSGLPRVHGVGSQIPPPPVVPAPEPPNGPYNFKGMRDYVENQYLQENRTYGERVTQNNVPEGQLGPSRAFFSRINTLREKEDLEGKSTEVMERDVALLNHCFDDIEKFVARLQQAAEAFKELERRKKDRGAKNRKRQGGDGMLSARAKPPPDKDFVDIFQKFKLSFNLLAKLRAHIHDPNAPELVHFLFTPLSLIYEASRDPVHGNKNLGDQAVAPVLTAEAKELLLNCLTTKEIELWQTLGKHWTTSIVEWHGQIPSYMPEFYDGWQPASILADEVTVRSAMMSQPPVSMAEPMRNPVVEERPNPYNPRPIPFPDEDPRLPPLIDRFSQAVSNVSNNHNDFDRSVRDMNSRPMNEFHSRQEANAAYLDELMKMEDVLIYEVTHDRTGKNSKELTVQKGDILQVLDNNRNWWKLRNYKGTAGFAPYTILTPVKGNETARNGDPMSARSASDYGAPRKGASRRDDQERRPRSTAQQRELTAEEQERRTRSIAQQRELTAEEKRNRFHRHEDDNFDPSPYTDHNVNYRRPNPPMPVKRSSYPSSKNRESDPSPSPRHSQLLPADYSDSPTDRRRSSNFSGGSRDGNHSPAIIGSYDLKKWGNDSTPPVSDYHSDCSTPPIMMNDDPGRSTGEQDDGRPRWTQGQVRGRNTHQEQLRSSSRQYHMHREPRTLPQDGIHLDISSSPSDVVKWLRQKGFSAGAQYAFRDYTGMELYQSHVSEFQSLLSHEEAIRLDGLLRLQKSKSGYATQSTKELNRILQRRKEHVSSTEMDETRWDSAHRQRPPSPDLDEPPQLRRKEPQRGPQGNGDFKELLIVQRSRLRQSQTSLDKE